MYDTIEQCMTPLVVTIGREQTLAEAHRVMREHGVRHLPVLHAGALVGMVTERDLNLIETLRSVDPVLAKVDDAMSEDVFAVNPGASLADVARRMASEKYGSAVVLAGKKVVGIFTAVDALRALDSLLTSRSALKL